MEIIHEKQQGFTLLESLISIGVIAVVSTLIAQAFFATTRTNTKTELQKDIKQNGEYAMQVMSRMIQNALKIETACSPSGTATRSLSIRTQHNTTTTFECAMSEGETRIASSGATGTFYLTSANVSLGGDTCDASSLQFICTTLPDEPTKVQISFRLSQKGTPTDQFEQTSISFQSSVAPRN